MKVLMLGWEFPPHISGGLGTACFGLVGGLRHNGVEVVFVVPHVFGDEDTANARLVGASGWTPRPRPAPPPTPTVLVPSAPDRGPESAAGAPEPASTAPTPGAAQSTATDAPGVPAVESEAPLRVLAVDSALAPYLGPEQYDRRVRELAPDAAAPTSPSAPERARPLPPALSFGPAPEPLGPMPPPPPPSPPEEVSPTAPVSLGVQAKTGRYSRDLFAEVERYTRVIEDIARHEHHDLVHAHDWMTFPGGVAAARASGRPLVVHVHSCEYDRSGEGANHRIVEIEQAGMDAADLVVCVSHYTADIVRSRYGIDERKIRVVHNAVIRRDHKDQRHGKAIEEPVVLFLGRVTFQKGPDYFLQAAALVVAEEPSVRFVLGGTGDMLPHMIETAAQIGLARNVFFTGFLAGDDVERMYAMADLYVMPSVSEPFGIAPLEAMALDVPVIVSRQSGVAEILHHALKVDFWDVRDMAEKILAVLRRPELRRTMVESGREEVAEMSWDLRGRHLAELYQEIAS